MGLMTPKGMRGGLSAVSEFKESGRLNQSTIDEFNTEDFQKKLMINPSDNRVLRENHGNSTEFGKYTLLSGKNRIGRLVSTQK
jgi:hypothetical protein